MLRTHKYHDIFHMKIVKFIMCKYGSVPEYAEQHVRTITRDHLRAVRVCYRQWCAADHVLHDWLHRSLPRKLLLDVIDLSHRAPGKPN